MAPALVAEIARQVESAEHLYDRLVLLVGPPLSGKTRTLRELHSTRGWPLVNVNLALSERLLELKARQRALRTARIVDEVVHEAGIGVVLLDNIEMLFDPGLQQDPLRLLQSLSRNRTVVANWRGAMVGSILTYASPDHPEYRRYENPQALVVAANLESGQRGARPDMEPST